MTTIALEAVDLFLKRLYADYRIMAACVGGAARDTYLGREPKDYDFVFLDTNGRDRAGVLDALVDIFGGVVDLEQSGSAENSDQRNLIGVWEALSQQTAYKPFQFLLYDEATTFGFQRNAAYAVAHHDCSLNHAWLAKTNAGRIVARVTDEFPNPATGNLNYFAPHTSATRKLYIQSKFPEFNHVI